MFGISIFIIGLGTVICLYLLIENTFKPLMNNRLDGTIKLPENREMGYIIDGGFKDIVKIMERTDVGSEGVIFKVMCERGEETRRFLIKDLHMMSKKQSIAGRDAPIYVTTSHVMDMLDVTDGSIKDSNIFRDVISKNNQLMQEKDDMTVRLNALESSNNLRNDDLFDKIVLLNRNITQEYAGGNKRVEA